MVAGGWTFPKNFALPSEGPDSWFMLRIQAIQHAQKNPKKAKPYSVAEKRRRKRLSSDSMSERFEQRQ